MRSKHKAALILDIPGAVDSGEVVEEFSSFKNPLEFLLSVVEK